MSEVAFSQQLVLQGMKFRTQLIKSKENKFRPLELYDREIMFVKMDSGIWENGLFAYVLISP
jgi:hypothetical protein